MKSDNANRPAAELTKREFISALVLHGFASNSSNQHGIAADSSNQRTCLSIHDYTKAAIELTDELLSCLEDSKERR